MTDHLDINDDLRRIGVALDAAIEALTPFTSGSIDYGFKKGDDPVTAADHAVDDVLRGTLPAPGEGWLSEETADDASRLDARRVWVVDPLDGTREFVAGIPEWCVSIGLVIDGRAVAGGIANPATGERFVGGVGVGIDSDVVRPPAPAGLDGEEVLASRSEAGRGEWERFLGQGFDVVPMGSVAYKLARVAAGLAAATWTLVPKHEWDVAGGVALLSAAGGSAVTLDGEPPTFNQPSPKLDGLVAGATPAALAECLEIIDRVAGRES